MLKLNHTFTPTLAIEKLLTELQAQKIAASIIPVRSETLANLRRNSRLSSALFSARIEGNKLNLDSYKNSPPNLEKLEISNLFETYNWLYAEPLDLPVDISYIKAVHKMSMHNLRSDSGHFRTEQSAIFNEAGVAIYLTPPVGDINPLVESWISNTPTSIVDALILHFQFEKIHPFLDGNGRVGRVLLTKHLRTLGLDFHGLLSIEKSIEESRSTYYYHLENSTRDLTSWIEYLLNIITKSATTALQQMSQRNVDSSHEQKLLPRRQEILSTIQDHSPCSLDFIQRRFMGIPASTLRYDLLQLQKSGLIKKLGETRGALYSSTSLPE